jgi:hypothetical protein
VGEDSATVRGPLAILQAEPKDTAHASYGHSHSHSHSHSHGQGHSHTHQRDERSIKNQIKALEREEKALKLERRAEREERKAERLRRGGGSDAYTESNDGVKLERNKKGKLSLVR